MIRLFVRKEVDLSRFLEHLDIYYKVNISIYQQLIKQIYTQSELGVGDTHDACRGPFLIDSWLRVASLYRARATGCYDVIGTGNKSSLIRFS